jgi:hypothetical protein
MQHDHDFTQKQLDCNTGHLRSHWPSWLVDGCRSPCHGYCLEGRMSKKNNPADKVEQWPIEKLVPYAKNSRTHSDEQVAQIAASIKEWGFTTAVLVDESGSIIAGHGRGRLERYPEARLRHRGG